MDIKISIKGKKLNAQEAEVIYFALINYQEYLFRYSSENNVAELMCGIFLKPLEK